MRQLEPDYYQILMQMVKDGSLDVIYVISPPRTFSTVMEIALTELGDGQIHEPFHKRSRKTFNEGCKLIYDRVLWLQNKLDRRNIRLIIKDLSKSLSEDDWKKLQKLAQRFVFTVREPSRQLFSLATRYANVLAGTEDELTIEEVIERIPEMPFEDLLDNYWRNLYNLFNLTKTHIKESELSVQKYIALVSGGTFRAELDNTIPILLKQLNLNQDNIALSSKWTKGNGDNFYKPPYVIEVAEKNKDYKNGSWLGKAIHSDAFGELSNADSPYDIDIYSHELQAYISDEILDPYVRMYLDLNHQAKPDFGYVDSKTFAQSLLATINPPEAYLLVKSYENHSKWGNSLNDILSSIRHNMSEMTPVLASEYEKVLEGLV